MSRLDNIIANFFHNSNIGYSDAIKKYIIRQRIITACITSAVWIVAILIVKFVI